MNPRECPFCGPENVTLLRRPQGDRVKCRSCGTKLDLEQWQRRHDDWRSDGWIADRDVIVSYRGKIFVGHYSIDYDGIVQVDGSMAWFPKSDCKWKPLPGGDQ